MDFDEETKKKKIDYCSKRRSFGKGGDEYEHNRFTLITVKGGYTRILVDENIHGFLMRNKEKGSRQVCEADSEEF